MTEKDIYDKNNYKYVGKANSYSINNCSLPEEYYLIKKRINRTYKKTYDVSYVLIDNIDNDTEVQIYHNKKLINFNIINKDNNQIKIALNNSYMCADFMFFVDTDKNYTISLYYDEDFQEQIITKNLVNQKISIPDETWITTKTKFITHKNMPLYEENSFISKIEEITTCAFQEKYVYKYNVIKEYYNNNYYTNIDGYIKDENDYKFYYKGEPMINTIEIVKEKIVEVPKIEYSYIEKIVEVPKVEYEYIEKIVEVPKVEYEYIEKIVEVPKIEYVYIENKIKENDSSKENTCEQEKVVEYKTKILEKKVYKVPVYLYMILIIFLILTIILIVKNCKKNVERNK